MRIYVYVVGSMLELNTEKERFMPYTVPEDAQYPRAVYTTNRRPTFEVFN